MNNFDKMPPTSDDAAALDALINQASDPTTSPERLRSFYLPDRFEAVLQALAGNPNTPSEVLLRLIETHPNEFLQNPVLPLLSLEDPDFAKKIPQQTALHLLRVEAIPVWLLDEFAKGEKLVARAARLHVGLAGEASEEWPAEVEGVIKTSVDAASLRMAEYTSPYTSSSGRDDSPGTVSLDMIPTLPAWFIEPVIIGVVEGRHPFWSCALASSSEAARTTSHRMRRAGSSNALTSYASPDLDISVGELELLARGGVWARTLAARHPNTPPDVLLQLAQDGFPVEENPNAPAALLQLVAEKENSRFAVARHPNTEAETLRRLANDKQNNVQVSVARHPNTPPEILSRFASDDDSFVRGGVARNSAASPELLTILAADAHAAVRFDVARHLQAPLDALRLLATDNDCEVLDALLRRSDLPNELRSQVQSHRAGVKKRLTWLSRKQLLRRVMGGALMREEVADKNGGLARLRAARSSKTSTHVLQTFVNDGEAAVRAALTTNVNTTPEILGALAGDKDPEVRAYVAANPRTPMSELRRLSDDGALKDDIPKTVARNRGISPEIIDHLIAKENSAIDESLVRNPATPLVVLQTLSARIKALEDLMPILRHRHADAALKAQVQQRVTQGVLLKVLRSSSALSQAAALSSPQTPPDDLAAAMTSTAWLSRLAVARHPATPHEVLRVLGRDGNRLVRAAARAALALRGHEENENL